MVKHSATAKPASRAKAHPAPGGAKPAVAWLTEPEDHDYPAAAAYLSLLADPEQVEPLVATFRVAPTSDHAAKDLLRASRLPLLPADDQHVAADLTKVHAGKPLSPILLVRGDLAAERPAVIADGYHRLCASYHTNANTPVRVRIIDLPIPTQR